MKKTFYIAACSTFVVIVGIVCGTILTKKPTVGLCIMATGKYIRFAEELIVSGREFFLTDCDVRYFVFTDGELQNPSDDITVIFQKRLGWPYDTMMRFEVYAQSVALLQDCDYIFSLDADMKFSSPIYKKDILDDLVGTQHPGFLYKRGTYETNSASRACVRESEGKYYFAGGFYGGNLEEFLKLVTTCTERIRQDLARGIVAIWHDESHLNRYFIDNPPTKILSPSYCYPENWFLPMPKKILALVKNHKEVRA